MLQVLLHDPKEQPQMKDLSISVSPGTHTKLAIKHSKVKQFTNIKEIVKVLTTENCVKSCNLVLTTIARL